MNAEDVIVKPVPPVRVAELSATAAGYGPEHIGPVVSPLYSKLYHRLELAHVTPAGPAMAYYEAEPDEAAEAVTVHAAVPVATGADPGQEFWVVDLPAIAEAATIIHHGSMDDVMHSLEALARWIEDHGYRPVGYHREVYLDYHPEKAELGVTELQVEIATA